MQVLRVLSPRPLWVLLCHRLEEPAVQWRYAPPHPTPPLHRKSSGRDTKRSGLLSNRVWITDDLLRVNYLSYEDSGPHRKCFSYTSPGILLKQSDFMDLGWGQRFCLSNKLPHVPMLLVFRPHLTLECHWVHHKYQHFQVRSRLDLVFGNWESYDLIFYEHYSRSPNFSYSKTPSALSNVYFLVR